jgi:hypothetical protein
MTDSNNPDDRTDSTDDLEDLGDEVMTDAGDVWGADGIEGGGFEGGGIDELDISLSDLSLGGLFGGDPSNVVEELLAIDELDEQQVEEVLTEFTVEKLVEADIHHLLSVSTISASEAAALIEWADDYELEDDRDGDEEDDQGNAGSGGSDSDPFAELADTGSQTTEESGSPRSNPGERTDETGTQSPETRRSRRARRRREVADSQEFDVDELEQETLDDGPGLGVKLGTAIAWPFVAIAGLLGSIAFGMTRLVPKRTAIYQKMIKLGYKGLYKKTGAHVIANTIYGDKEMVPRKAEYDSDEGNLETDNGEWWTASSGLQPVFLGDVPIVYGVADDHELVNPIAARIAEAVDLGPQRWQAVRETTAGYAPISADSGAGARGTAAAVTDGGVAGELGLSSTFDDLWLDVSNPIDDNDGMIVSLQKAYELHWDQGSSEEMENQETRGMLAVMDPRSDRKKALIYVLLFAAGIALGMFGPSLAASIAPGDGGGGFSVGLWIAISSLLGV